MYEREWHGRCHRCSKESMIHIMSRFNRDLICMDCEEAERKLPRYQEAVEAEAAACRQGNYNFLGIGYTKP